MDTTLRIFLGVGVLFYYVMLFFMLKKGRLILKYALLWLLAGLALAIFLIRPEVLYKTSDLIGVSNPVNAVFLLFAGITLLLVLSLTSIVSQFNKTNRQTIQKMALLEKRLRDLEDKQEARDGQESEKKPGEQTFG